MINAKMVGIVAAALVAAVFSASPELRAYASTIANDVICNGCVGTSDLASNAVTAAKIRDGEVKAPEIAANAVGASEIATDAVGAAEIQGVTKLLFGQCVATDFQKTTAIEPGEAWVVLCNIAGVDADDSASATLNESNFCFEVRQVDVTTGRVNVSVANDCTATTTALGSSSSIAVIVYDK